MSSDHLRCRDRDHRRRRSPDGTRDILGRWAQATAALQAQNHDLLQQMSELLVQQRTARYVQVPKYDGSRSWCVFEAQFQSVAVENGWSVEEQGHRLLGALEGLAADAVQTLPRNEYLNYASLSDCLRQHFDWARGTAVAELQFEHRTQQPEESLHEFATALLCLARAAYPTWPDHIIQTVTKRLFLGGIRDTAVRRAVHLQQPKDLNDAVAVAVHVEMVNNLDPVRAAQVFPTEAAAVQIWDGRGVDVRRVAPADGPEHLRDDERSWSASLSVRTSTADPGSPCSSSSTLRHAASTCSWRSRARSRSPRRDRCDAARRGACFFCGETGHLRRSCPHEDRPS